MYIGHNISGAFVLLLFAVVPTVSVIHEYCHYCLSAFSPCIFFRAGRCFFIANVPSALLSQIYCTSVANGNTSCFLYLSHKRREMFPVFSS